MNQKSSVPQKVIEYVTKHETISIGETVQDLNVSRTTAKNYLSRLSKMGIVKRMGREYNLLLMAFVKIINMYNFFITIAKSTIEGGCDGENGRCH